MEGAGAVSGFATDFCAIPMVGGCKPSKRPMDDRALLRSYAQHRDQAAFAELVKSAPTHEDWSSARPVRLVGRVFRSGDPKKFALLAPSAAGPAQIAAARLRVGRIRLSCSLYQAPCNVTWPIQLRVRRASLASFSSPSKSAGARSTC